MLYPFPLNLISFFFLSWEAFQHDLPYLFYGFDGGLEVSLIAQGSIFAPPLLGFTNDFIHGLGNVWFAVSPWLIPEYFLTLDGPGKFANFSLSYAISATELFVGTYFLGRLIGASRLVAIFAAWLLPLLCFQYAGWDLVPVSFRAFPHYALVAAVTNLTAALLLRIGRESSVRFAAVSAGLCFLAISYVVIAAPTLLILASPQLVVFGMTSLFAAWRRHHLAIAMSAMASVVMACILAGYAHFIAGLVGFTAANMFRGLSIAPRDLGEVSMLFWSPLHPHFFTIERSFVLLGLLGALWAVIRETSIFRLAAIAFLTVATVYILAGLVHVYHPYWFGPQFWYFEGFLFPLHALFAAFLVLEPLRVIGRMEVISALVNRFSQAHWLTAACVLLLATAPWYYVRHEQKRIGTPDLPYYTPYPQAETPITRILKQEIALVPGAPFRGREATLNGRIFPSNISVDIPGLSDIPNVLAMHATGNSHNTEGLWQDSIPTLVEYGQLLTPPNFVFMRRFFTEPVDVQYRNIVAMRHVDPRLLAAVGVRFVVTDKPVDGLKLRQTIDVPVSDDFVRRLGVQRAIDNFSLYLYELDNVNLGQYSPTKVRAEQSASAIVDALADSSVNLFDTAITSEKIEGVLVPAEDAVLKVGRGYFSVQATSQGHSILILPMEYSRCLSVSASGGEIPQPRLFRADLLMTGVVFDKRLDATIAYRTGPFGHARCRLRDMDDMEQIRLSDAFKTRPEFLPGAAESK